MSLLSPQDRKTCYNVVVVVVIIIFLENDTGERIKEKEKKNTYINGVKYL